MRLSVIIPAYNEAPSVGAVVAGVPRTLPGIDVVDVLVVDDGSTDGTDRAARAAGADVVSHPRRLGLAAAFRTGLAQALHRNADLIATLDADGQYRPAELALLLSTLRTQRVDLVSGDRQVWTLAHMPIAHRTGNIVGSWMLRVLGTTRIRDASSGFRMFTRAFARKLRITSEHTYTHEMLIQAGVEGFRTAEVAVTFLPRTHGKSKLVRSVRHHILRSCGTILRSLFLYRPLRKFLLLAAVCLLASLGFLLFALASGRLVGMLIAAGIVFVLGIQFLILGLIADAQAAQRRVLQEEASVSGA